ncbi:nuclease domain-containing protein [Burkholderia cenocepacia]|uniref:nuclease domain-containing protein n=1 Tax=Burkholderia cenocepacia TaxID=95486 RepID=UPI00201155FC|nr:nuclease domain-containing protein [Burkholderia cenocepacia]
MSGFGRAQPREDCVKRERTLKRTPFKVKAKPGQWSTFSKPSKGFQRKAADPAARDQKPAKRHRVSRPKKATGEDAKYLAACRGEPCYLLIRGICPRRSADETVVPAHRNEGKGMGLKVPDRLTVPACYWCHAEYDQGHKLTRDEKREMWNQAFRRWEPARNEKMGIRL